MVNHTTKTRRCKQEPIDILREKLPSDLLPSNSDGWAQYKTICPSHDDHKPSLGIHVDGNGDCGVFCRAGCTSKAVLAAIGLKPADMFQSNGRRSEVVAEWEFRNEHGKLVYVKYKKSDKSIGYYHVVNGKKVYKRPKKLVTLYRMHELQHSTTLVVFTEGEKDADTVVHKLLTNAFTSGGANSWLPKFAQHFKGKNVVICQDNDTAGKIFSRQVANSIFSFAESVKILPPFPDVKYGGDVSDWVENGGSRDQFLEFIKETPRYEPNKTKEIITINNGDLGEMTDKVHEELMISNNPDPWLFRRANKFVRRTKIGGRIVLEECTTDVMRDVMTQGMHFDKEYIAGDNKLCAPSLDLVVNTKISALRHDYPEIVAVKDSPHLDPDGKLIRERGYDPRTKIYLEPAAGQEIDVPEKPTEADEIRAWEKIYYPFLDFPFATEASRINLVAMSLIQFLPYLGPRPAGLVGANNQGIGKTLECKALSRIASGRDPLYLPYNKNEGQFGADIISALLSDYDVIMLDNIVGELKSETLAQVLTSNEFTRRKYGSNDAASNQTAPNRKLWLINGNNPKVNDDMARRIIWIENSYEEDDPDLRDPEKFHESNLEAYLTAHRWEQVSARLTVCRAWYANGCKAGPQKIMGAFQATIDALSGVLYRYPEFLANAKEMRAKSNDERSSWTTFFAAWLGVMYSRGRLTGKKDDLGGYEVDGELLKAKPIPARTIADWLPGEKPTKTTLEFLDTVPDFLKEKLHKQGVASFITALGKALSAREDQPHNGFVVKKTKRKDRTGATLWQVIGPKKKIIEPNEGPFG